MTICSLMLIKTVLHYDSRQVYFYGRTNDLRQEKYILLNSDWYCRNVF